MMKKALLFAVISGAVSFSSCKKDYTCTSTYGGEEYVDRYPDQGRNTASLLEDLCESEGGIWASE